MSYVILKFKLPEEQNEFETMQSAYNYLGALQNFDNWLRGITKHGDEAAQNLKADDVRDKLWACINENDAGW